ncbi:MAG: hypothetical protein ABSH52_12015 [Terriglobia bacterium]
MNPPPAVLVSAAEVAAGAGSAPALAERAGGEVTGGSTLAVVSSLGWLDDEGVDTLLGFVSDGGTEDAERVRSLVPIGTVSGGGLTVGGMAPKVVTRSVAGDMRPDLSL